VSVPPGDRAIELTVIGQPQHIIAYTDFSGQTEDDPIGEHDYRDMIVTVTIEEDRHAEGAWPILESSLPLTDVARTKVINAGDRFRQDYVAPNTVVDIDDDGDLVYSTGGFVHDDTEMLETIARLAYLWYGDYRYAMYVSSDFLTSRCGLGDIVESIGDATVANEGHDQSINTVISEIRVSAPISEGADNPLPARMSITTNWGQLDPMNMLAASGRF